MTTNTNQSDPQTNDLPEEAMPNLSDSAWGKPSSQIRPLSKRYQATFRYVTNKAIVWIGALLVISGLLNLLLVSITVSVDVEDLYATDGTIYSCKLSK